jgi:single cache domain-containing protein
MRFAATKQKRIREGYNLRVSILHRRALLAAHVPTRRKSMIRTFMIAAASAAVVTLSPAVFGQQPGHGTADQAKAMLLKAVAAVKADKTKALNMFNTGEGGFLDRDLYVFCANTGDGKIVAIGNPNAKQLLGQDQRTLKDPTGKTFGLDLYAAGQKPEGQITEVRYMFVRPGPDTKPVPKVSLVTRVGDLVCGVGYYK